MRKHGTRLLATSFIFSLLVATSGAHAASAVGTVFEEFMKVARQTPSGAANTAADAAKLRNFNKQASALVNKLVPANGSAIARGHVNSVLRAMQSNGDFGNTLEDAFLLKVLDDVAAGRTDYTGAMKQISDHHSARLKDIQGKYATIGGSPTAATGDAGHLDGGAATNNVGEAVGPAKVGVAAGVGRDAAANDLRSVSDKLSSADKQHYDDIIKETNQPWDENALRGLTDTLRGTDDYIKGAMRADLTKAIADAKAAGKTDEANRLQLILDKLGTSPNDASVRKFAAEAVLLKQGVPKENVAKMMDCFR